MSIPQAPKLARLIIGLFMRDRSLLSPLVDELVARYGPLDLISDWFPFDYTEYYRAEMGPDLSRRMLVFKKMIEQRALPDIKIFTNGLERKNASGNNRRVNIDPGYLVPERFVLATGKNFSHRIYLDQGIYADLTLIYQKGRFITLPWTYPDYAAANMLGFLETVREKYLLELKEMG